MIVAEVYSHKNGLEYIQKNHSAEFHEIQLAIANIDSLACLCKKSEEKTKASLIFSPIELNKSLKGYLCERGWTEKVSKSKKSFREPRISMGDGGEFREMDGIKNRVGLEIQFGKYAFMAYDILSKMPIFSKRGLIDCGIELVAMPSLVRNMSTGVSSFNQIVTELKERGSSNLDIPTIIIGIDCDSLEWKKVQEKRARYAISPLELHANGEVMGARRGTKPGPKSY